MFFTFYNPTSLKYNYAQKGLKRDIMLVETPKTPKYVPLIHLLSLPKIMILVVIVMHAMKFLFS